MSEVENRHPSVNHCRGRQDGHPPHQQGQVVDHGLQFAI